MNREIRKTLLLASFLLTACNSGGGDSENSTNQSSLEAQFMQASINLDQSQMIDLESAIVSEGSAVVLSELHSLTTTEDGTCEQYSLSDSGLKFETTYDTAVSCTYQYEVTNDNGQQAEHLVQINASKSLPGIAPYLHPLHEQMQVSDLPKEVIPTDDPNVSVPLGFTLSSSYTVIGEDTNAVTLNGTSDGFMFTPTSEGITRIHYSYEDSSNGYVVSGTLTFSVAVDTNNAPKVTAATHSGEIYQSNIVDLSTNMSDTDGDALQIIEVTAQPNVNVSITNSQELTYETQLPGDYTVYYIVSDHNGGYARGELNLKAYARSKPAFAKTTSNILILPPLLASVADEQGVMYSDTETEDGTAGPDGYEIAKLDWQTANAYCTTRGLRLPTEAELLDIWNGSGNLWQSHRWSAKISFWSSDPGATNTYKTVNMIDDAQHDTDIDNPHYVGCVMEVDGIASISVTPATSILTVGEQETLMVEAETVFGKKIDVIAATSLAISNGSSITIQGNTVTAIQEGSSSIEATLGDATATSEIHVIEGGPYGLDESITVGISHVAVSADGGIHNPMGRRSK